MKKYRVIVTVDASVCIEVEAGNEEEAKDRAMEQASPPCLCHRCSGELYVGDPIDAVEATEIK